MSLPEPSKLCIEREARAARAANLTIEDACPYPHNSDAGRHFAAIYLLVGTKYDSTQNSAPTAPGSL